MENLNKPLDENNLIDIDSFPKIYSKKTIVGFSVFFTTIFGGVLLMQNLRDIGKKKEAIQILFLSIGYSIITIVIANLPEKPITSLTFLCNMIGGIILAEYFFKKYFPDDEKYEKKKIWKPLVISIIITIPFLLALIFSSMY